MDHILLWSFCHSAVAYAIGNRVSSHNVLTAMAPGSRHSYLRCPGLQPQIERYHGSSVLGVVLFRLIATLSSGLDSFSHTNFFRRTPPTASCRGCLHDFGRNCGDLAVVLPVHLCTS